MLLASNVCGAVRTFKRWMTLTLHDDGYTAVSLPLSRSAPCYLRCITVSGLVVGRTTQGWAACYQPTVSLFSVVSAIHCLLGGILAESTGSRVAVVIP